MSFLLNFRSIRIIRLISLIFFCFFVFSSPVSAQYIGNCPDEKDIKTDANGWRDSQPEFQRVPPNVPAFYDPYLDNNFAKNTHLDTSMLPNPDNLACLIAYAQEEWFDLYGTEFNDQDAEKVINFAIKNQYNPSLLLALWSEETHGGDMSSIELGCGSANGLDAQLKCLTGIDPKYKLNTFACFLGSYAGDTPLSLNCGYGDPDNVITNPFFPYIIQYYNYLVRGVTPGNPITPSPIPTNFKIHPLRPFPDQPIAANPPLTPYCAMRPTPVQLNRFDIREPLIDLKTVGTLTQDFTKFVTPLLSITDPKKADYQLHFNEKAQRYLADFLEGRAYYEPFPEPSAPTFTQQQDIFNRMGVFRKLAPQQYQNELKRAVIYRAADRFNLIPNPYGFTPASTKINNYTVSSWQNKPVTLKDYFNNQAWAPLPEEYENNPDKTYTQAYYAWKTKDNGKWYSLWPYVPMFTREDTTGYIEIKDSNPPPDPWSPPGSTPVEINNTNDKTVDVVHPHLARTYEVSSSLNLLLNPAEVPKPPAVPEMAEEWTVKLWEGPIWWLDPSLQKPHLKFVPPLIYGPMCDVDPALIKPIRSSGDLAFDSIISTNVNRQDLDVVNPEYDPTADDPVTETCEDKFGTLIEITHDKCEQLKGDYCNLDDSKCYYFKQIRSDPNYLISYTPFLNEITANLISTESGLFNIFRPSGTDQKPYEKYGWPGLGNEGEESPQYDFAAADPSYAEAGARKPGDTQSYYYRYLGSVQCAKEKVLQVLQPFITGSPYKPYAKVCFGYPSSDYDPKNPANTDDSDGDGIPDTTDNDSNDNDAVPGTGGDLEFPNTATSPIARRAYEIVNSLTRGKWNYWNVSPDHPYALFWCTWLVVDAFNDNGGSIPEPNATNGILYTPTMVSWFQNQGKYLAADDITLDQVKPGYAVFFKVKPPSDGVDRLNHAAIVYSVTPGQGFTTVESNAGYRSMFYPVDDTGHFLDVSVGSKTISMEGFGTP